MPEFGLLQGLSQDMGYDNRINDLRWHEQQNKRALAENESKAKLFADDLDYQNAQNQHDAPIIREESKNKIKEIGKFVRENPDWTYNVDKRLQLNEMKKSLKDNESLKRGVASDNAYKSYLGDLQEVAKNPNAHDTEAYQSISDQWNNYLNHGNQGGLEAAQREGKKAFVYQKPQDFVDLPQTLLKAGNSVKNYDVKKGRNIGEYWTEPKPEEVDAIKKSIYQQNGRQIQVEAKKLGLTTPQEIDKWVTDNISAGFNKHYSIGDANAAFTNGMALKNYELQKEKGQKSFSESYTPFDNLIDPKNPAGTIPVDLARKIWNDKPNIQVLSSNGSKVDLTGFNMNYDGRFVKKNGIPFLLGYIDIPLKVAEEKGIYEDGWFGKPKITSDFLDKATIETTQDKDNNEQKFVRIKHEIPVNPNDQTARQMYNVQADVDKLVPAAQNPYKQEMPTTVVQGGITYYYNPKTGKYE